MTTKKQDTLLQLPSHEQLSQEIAMSYALALHNGTPTTREQKLAAIAQEHAQLLRYHAVKVSIAHAEMEKIRQQGGKSLYAILEHHDALNHAARTREGQSKELSSLVEQFTRYDLEAAVIHAQKLNEIGFYNLSEVLRQPIAVPSEPEIIIKEVERPGFFRRLLGG